MPEKPMWLANMPDGLCYDCRGCGDCCRGLFTIVVTRAERDRILAQGWENDPPLFLPRGDRFVLNHNADGACVFLDERGLCRIHARFGEPAKPLPCRLYPFVFIPVAGGVRTDIRFDCPAVAENNGRPLADYRASLKALLPQVVPAEALAMPAPPLFGRVALPWEHLLRITGAVTRLLTQTPLDLTRRMLCAVNMAAVLRNPRLREVDGAQLDELLRRVHDKVVEAAGGDDPLPRLRPSAITGATFRQLLAAYSRADRFGDRPNRWARLTTSLRMLRGQGTVPPLRPGFPAIRFDLLETPFGIPDGEAEAALLRFYRMKLDSVSFCGLTYYHRPFLDGLGALLLTYPMTLWFARAYAAAAGHTALDRIAIERALSIIDHQHGRAPLLNIASERFRVQTLTERETLRGLIAWYGG